MAARALVFKYNIDPSGNIFDPQGSFKIYACTIFGDGTPATNMYAEPEVIVNLADSVSQIKQSVTDAVRAYGNANGFPALVPAGVLSLPWT